MYKTITVTTLLYSRESLESKMETLEMRFLMAEKGCTISNQIGNLDTSLHNKSKEHKRRQVIDDNGPTETLKMVSNSPL